MVEAYLTFMILVSVGCLVALVLQVVPERVQERIARRLGMDWKSYGSYDHTGDED
jgi:hypothetical protein